MCLGPESPHPFDRITELESHYKRLHLLLTKQQTALARALIANDTAFAGFTRTLAELEAHIKALEDHHD